MTNMQPETGSEIMRLSTTEHAVERDIVKELPENRAFAAAIHENWDGGDPGVFVYETVGEAQKEADKWNAVEKSARLLHAVYVLELPAPFDDCVDTRVGMHVTIHELKIDARVVGYAGPQSVLDALKIREVHDS